MKINELSPNEMGEILKTIIKNNVGLAEKGIVPIACKLIGNAGIAKTSIVEQIANDEFKNTHHFVKINPANMEVGDLLGNPIVEYEICGENTTKCIWVSKEILPSFIDKSFKPTGNSRTSYATPEWIQGKQDMSIILLIDDKSRSTQMVLQALMDLEDRQCTTSWKLPGGSTVISTENPSNGDFIVTDSDDAQNSRSLSFYIKADIPSWSYWATNKIDERFINFIEQNEEVIYGNNETNQKLANLRIWTKYFNVISCFENLKDNWSTVLNIGIGSIPEDHLLLFNAFINQGLDVIPKAIDCLNNKYTIEELEEITKNNNIIKVMLANRLLNYILVNTELENSQYDTYINILNNSNITSNENIFRIMTRLINKYDGSTYLMSNALNTDLKDKLLC